MWPLPDDKRWDPGRSHRRVNRVDLWSKAVLIASDVPYIEGSVSEKWTTGIRSTMNLTVPTTPQWLNWLALDDLELLPYSGMAFSPTSEFLVPLGVFPVLFPGVDVPAKGIGLQMEDQWQFVASANFMYPVMSYTGTIVEVATRLITELALGGARKHPITANPIDEPHIRVSNTTATVTSVKWERSRHDTIAELVQSIAVEVERFNRWGQAELRDHQPLPGLDLSDGPAGTLISVTSAVNWAEVVNSIAVTSSKNDVTFDPVVESITDTNHPAHISKIGPRYLAYSSPQIADANQARDVAKAELAKRSAPARTWNVTCVPDPTRMPGDLLTLTTRLHGPVPVVVQEITHPLGDGPQQLKLGAPL